MIVAQRADIGLAAVIPAGRAVAAVPDGGAFAARRSPLLLASVVWLFSPSSAMAAEVGEALRGVWGTDAACNQWRAGEPDTPELGPYEITEQWIRRWQFYCFIAGETDLPAASDAWEMTVVCGEGVTPRRYHLDLAIMPGDRLTMRWQMIGEPDAHTVGPLQRCEQDE